MASAALSADAHILLAPDQNLRDEFACPITYELIHDPVIAADGHTYDRSAIQRWLAKHDTSPKVRAVHLLWWWGGGRWACAWCSQLLFLYNRSELVASLSC